MTLMSTRKDPTAGRRTWHLTDMPTAMIALSEILALQDENGISLGYRGAPLFVNSQVVGLEINGPNTRAQQAMIGDFLVEDIGIRAFTADLYAANYDTEPGA